MDVKDLAQWLGERLDKLETKMDSMGSNVTINTADLSHHISRTDALEARVEQVDTDARATSKTLRDVLSRAKGGAAVMGVFVTVLELWYRFLHH